MAITFPKPLGRQLFQGDPVVGVNADLRCDRHCAPRYGLGVGRGTGVGRTLGVGVVLGVAVGVGVGVAVGVVEGD